MPISPLQSQTAGPSLNGSYDIQFQNNVATGNLIVAVYWRGDVTRSVTYPTMSISDDQGNTYSFNFRVVNAGNDHAFVAIAYAIIAAGGVKPVISIGMPSQPVTLGGASGAAVYEYPKPNTAGGVSDSTASNVDSSGSTAMSSGNLTTAVDVDLLIAIGAIADSTAISPGSGFSTLYSWTGIGSFVGLVESKDTGTAGSYSGDMTGSGSDPWVVLATAFKIFPPVVYNDSISMGMTSGLDESTALTAVGTVNAGVGSGMSDDASEVLSYLASLATSEAFSVLLANNTAGASSLGVLVGVADNASILLVQALIFGCSIAIADVESVSWGVSGSLGVAAGTNDSVAVSAFSTAVMAVAVSLADAIVQSIPALVAWAVQSGLISSSTDSMSASSSLGVAAGLSPSSATATSDSIAAGIIAGLSSSAVATSPQSISAGVGLNTGLSGSSTVSGALGLGVLAGASGSVSLNAQTLAAVAVALSTQASSLNSALYVLGMAIGVSLAGAPGVITNGSVSINVLLNYLVSMPGVILTPGLAKIFAKLLDSASIQVKSSNAKLSDKPTGSAGIVPSGGCS